MKAMVFAAGVGSRLKPFTDLHPKALVEVGGMPMLQHVILKLRDAGINDIVINIHHFADQIIDFVHQHDMFGVNITFSDESAHLLDTGGGLVKAAHLLDGDEPILLHNADILTDFSLEEMISVHKQRKYDATLLVAERQTSRYLLFDNEMCMRGWENISTGAVKPANLCTSGLNRAAFGGVHIIQPSILKYLSEYSGDDSAFSITNFYIDMCNKLRIGGFIPRNAYSWYDVGKPSALAEACTAFAR